MSADPQAAASGPQLDDAELHREHVDQSGEQDEVDVEEASEPTRVERQIQRYVAETPAYSERLQTA